MSPTWGQTMWMRGLVRREGNAADAADPYAIAFGHFSNKNVDLVVDAWSVRAARGDAPMSSLRLVGVSDD